MFLLIYDFLLQNMSNGYLVGCIIVFLFHQHIAQCKFRAHENKYICFLQLAVVNILNSLLCDGYEYSNFTVCDLAAITLSFFCIVCNLFFRYFFKLHTQNFKCN